MNCLKSLKVNKAIQGSLKLRSYPKMRCVWHDETLVKLSDKMSIRIYGYFYLKTITHKQFSTQKIKQLFLGGD